MTYRMVSGNDYPLQRVFEALHGGGQMGAETYGPYGKWLETNS